jgi:hypothetical protein
MNGLKYPEWQEPYEAAWQECDPQKLLVRVAVAETTIYLRSRALRKTASGHEEWQAIADALNGLLRLRRERLTFLALDSVQV